MFLIDNSKKGDIEYYKVSLCELVFWVIRAKLQSGFAYIGYITVKNYHKKVDKGFKGNLRFNVVRKQHV